MYTPTDIHSTESKNSLCNGYTTDQYTAHVLDTHIANILCTCAPKSRVNTYTAILCNLTLSIANRSSFGVTDLSVVEEWLPSVLYDLCLLDALYLKVGIKKNRCYIGFHNYDNVISNNNNHKNNQHTVMGPAYYVQKCSFLKLSMDIAYLKFNTAWIKSFKPETIQICISTYMYTCVCMIR